jgi:hypothetical protein
MQRHRRQLKGKMKDLLEKRKSKTKSNRKVPRGLLGTLKAGAPSEM